MSSDTACYVYCVARDDDRDRTSRPAGVDPAHPVYEVRYGELVALVSQVTLAEFGAEALKRNLEDLGWLERAALAHDNVIRSALSRGAVVPLRLCTIFADDSRVGEMLERDEEHWRSSLERVKDRTEWSVKLLADRRVAQASARERSAPALAGQAASAPGHAFFARKQGEAQARRHASENLAHAVEAIVDRLRAEAAGTVRLPAQNRALSRHAGEMIFNGAYLVDTARADAFAGAAAALGREYARAGVRIELTGPFAPYNFVGGSADRA